MVEMKIYKLYFYRVVVKRKKNGNKILSKERMETSHLLRESVVGKTYHLTISILK